MSDLGATPRPITAAVRITASPPLSVQLASSSASESPAAATSPMVPWFAPFGQSMFAPYGTSLLRPSPLLASHSSLQSVSALSSSPSPFSSSPPPPPPPPPLSSIGWPLPRPKARPRPASPTILRTTKIVVDECVVCPARLPVHGSDGYAGRRALPRAAVEALNIDGLPQCASLLHMPKFKQHSGHQVVSLLQAYATGMCGTPLRVGGMVQVFNNTLPGFNVSAADFPNGGAHQQNTVYWQGAAFAVRDLGQPADWRSWCESTPLWRPSAKRDSGRLCGSCFNRSTALRG